MRALDPGKILFLDCQTTGMQPAIGQLLEIAWESSLGGRSFLIELAAENSIPARVSDITGITLDHLARAVPEESALAALEGDLASLGDGAVIVAHYAQFERAFLQDLYQRLRGAPLPWKFLCTFKIARLLRPDIPSRNIRALVGYFGLGSTEIRRAADHVAATVKIWRNLESVLPVSGLPGIEAWLASTKAEKGRKASFRMDRLKRLQLPEDPGVYRMLAQDGKVLYVGKATSLRARVNSYFRGRGQGGRKREMVAQVWDVEVVRCGSALEAALLETEEIKRFDPPYNVALRTGRRSLLFYSRDFQSQAVVSDELHCVGPFAHNNAVAALLEWLGGGKPLPLFYSLVPEEARTAGEALFLRRHEFQQFPLMRPLVALGLRLLREHSVSSELLEAADESSMADAVSAEDMAARLESLTMRAAWEYRRSKKLTRLLNCRVRLEKEGRVLDVRAGQLGGGEPVKGWNKLGIAEYDRMSVLLTETARHAYPVEWATSP